MAPPHPATIDWDAILAAAGPYPMDALNFVREGLSYTVHRLHEHPEQLPEFDRHVSGQQLCMGLRDFAICQYGMLAGAVLGHWSIVQTADFGRLVFAMIDAGVMSKAQNDSTEDFYAVFDFEEAFNPAELADRIGCPDD